VPDLSLGDVRLYERLRHGKFTLLDRTSAGRYVDEVESGWSDRVVTVRAPHAVAPGWPAVTLIRPDGYTAWATSGADQPDEVRTALHHWCGVTHSADIA
jgi:rifampicin monooxygenase